MINTSLLISVFFVGFREEFFGVIFYVSLISKDFIWNIYISLKTSWMQIFGAYFFPKFHIPYHVWALDLFYYSWTNHIFSAFPNNIISCSGHETYTKRKVLLSTAHTFNISLSLQRVNDCKKRFKPFSS